MTAPRWAADFERYPLVLLHVVGAQPGVAPDVETLFASLEAIRARPGRKAVVIDLTFAMPDAQRRQRFVQWAKSHQLAVREQVVALAAVAPSAFHRSIVTAVLWFVTPQVPVQVCANRDEAVRYATVQLRAAGLPVPGARSHGTTR